MRVSRLPVLPAAIATVAILLAGPVTALTVTEWGKALAAPRVAGPGFAGDGRALTFGHLELRTAGTIVPVVVGDRLVGVYLPGSSTLRYVSTDPLEAATYRTNVERVSSYEVDAKGAITDAVEGALIMISSGAEALEADDPGWWQGPASPAHVARFTEHLRRFSEDRFAGYRSLFPQVLAEGSPQPVVVAEIVGARHDLCFVLDPFRDHDESLAVLKEVDTDISFLKHRRYPEVLSRQLVGRTWLDPEPRRAVLTAVDLTLVNPDGLRAELEVTEEFVALAPLRTLDLSLWTDQWGGVGPSGRLELHAYELTSVTTEGGVNLPFVHHRHQLIVELPQVVQRGDRFTLKFSIAGDVLFRPEQMSYWELDTGGAWLPVPGWEAQAMTYHAVIKVKKPFTAFSNGRTVRRWQEGDLECAEFREDKPIQVPVILAGKYTTYSEERGGTTVRVSTYVSSDEKAKRKLTNLVFTFLEFYKPLLGEYPFGELNLIEINDYGFGQAPAGIIFITKEAFQPLQDELARLVSEGVNARVAHEVAHAWWGHVAKLSYQDQWLSESVAEYYSAYAVGQLRKDEKLSTATGEWRGKSNFVKDKATVYMANALSGDKAGDDRYGLLYGKGPLVLHALRKEVGDNMFFTILKSYLKSFYFKPASTKNFIELTNFATKKDYTDFFNRYLLGTEWPKS
jgi:hypothetical protein